MHEQYYDTKNPLHGTFSPNRQFSIIFLVSMKHFFPEFSSSQIGFVFTDYQKVTILNFFFNVPLFHFGMTRFVSLKYQLL